MMNEALTQCKRCKKLKSRSLFRYQDRNVCTRCLIQGQIYTSNARARGYLKSESGELSELSFWKWYSTLEKCNFCCVMCGKGGDENFPLEIDHIVPLSKDGSHEISNLRPLCNTCNISRGNGSNRGTGKREINDFPCTCPYKGQPIENHWHKCVLSLAVKRRELAKAKEEKRMNE